MAGTLNVVAVALGILVNPLPVFRCHCTVIGELPLAEAVKVAVPPLHAVTLAG